MEADLLARAGLPELAELAGQQGEQGEEQAFHVLAAPGQLFPDSGQVAGFHMADAGEDIAFRGPGAGGQHVRGDGPGHGLPVIRRAQEQELFQFVLHGLGIGGHGGAELFEGIGLEGDAQGLGAVADIFLDAALAQAFAAPDPALLIGKAQAAQLGDVGRDLGLAFFPGHFQAEERPALFRGPGQSGGDLFPDRGGPEMGLTHHQQARRAEQALEGELFPEARRRLLVPPVNMSFPAAAVALGAHEGFQTGLQKAAVRADEKGKTGSGHGRVLGLGWKTTLRGKKADGMSGPSSPATVQFGIAERGSLWASWPPR